MMGCMIRPMISPILSQSKVTNLKTRLDVKYNPKKKRQMSNPDSMPMIFPRHKKKQWDQGTKKQPLLQIFGLIKYDRIFPWIKFGMHVPTNLRRFFGLF